MKYQLREIEIKNYRSISYAKFISQNGKFILIGKNSVGKTNALQFIADVLRINGSSEDNPSWNSNYNKEEAYLDPNQKLELILKYKILDATGLPTSLFNHMVNINNESYLMITFQKKLNEAKGGYFIGTTEVSNPEYVKKERQRYFNALFIPSLRTLGSRHTSEIPSYLGNISLEQILDYCIRVFVRREKASVNTTAELIKELQRAFAGNFAKTIAPDMEVSLSTKEGADIDRYIIELKKDENEKEFREKIPEVLNNLKEWTTKLQNGLIPPEELVVRMDVTKKAEDYRANVAQKAALIQLAKRGIEVNEGEPVHFIYSNFNARKYENRIQILQNRHPRIDIQKYEELFVRATYELLNFLKQERQVLELAAQSVVQTTIRDFIKIEKAYAQKV